MSNTRSDPLIFEGFELDARRGSLMRRGEAMQIRDQTLRLLCLLASAKGELVTRAELARALWGEADIDYDQRLNAAVRDLRRVLEDDVKAPRIVRTHPRKGYSFAATFDHPVRRRSIWGLATALLAVAGFALRWFSAEPPTLALDESAPSSYIEARALIDSYDPSQHERADALLRHAIAMTPERSNNWSALSTLLCQKQLAPADKYPEARQAATRALELDEHNVEARLRLATIAISWDRDWRLAEKHLQAALDHSPGNANVHHALAALHYLQGDLDLGEAAMLKGLTIDPLSTMLHTDLVWYYTASGEYEKALDQCALLARIDAANAASAGCALQPNLLLGRTEEAARLAGRVLMEGGVTPRGTTPQHVLDEYWRRLLDSTTAASRQRYVDPVNLALVHAQLGHPAMALEWLEKAVATRSSFAPYIHLFPEFRGLHSQARFSDLLAQIGLPDEPGRVLARLHEDTVLRRRSALLPR